MRTDTEAFDRIRDEVLAALKLSTADGGLIVLLDGFFTYELTGDRCRSIVAAPVARQSLFWGQVCCDGAQWNELFAFASATAPPLPVVRVDIDRAPLGAVLAQASTPELANPAWLPNWTKETRFEPLPMDWRQKHSPSLLMDLTCAGGVVTALADRYAANVVVGTARRRVSTVGVYVVLGQGRGTVQMPPLTTAFEFGSQAVPWAVLVLSHRQRAQNEHDVKAVGHAHDQAIARLHGKRFPNARPLQKLHKSALPSYPYPLDKTIDDVVKRLGPEQYATPEDVEAGQRSLTSRLLRAKLILEGGQTHCSGSFVKAEDSRARRP